MLPLTVHGISFSIGTGTGKGAVPSCGIEITEIHRFAENGDFPRLVSVESVRRSYVGRDCPVRIHRAPTRESDTRSSFANHGFWQ